MGNLTASIQSAPLKTEICAADPGVRLRRNDAHVKQLFCFIKSSYPKNFKYNPKNFKCIYLENKKEGVSFSIYPISQCARIDQGVS